MKSIKMNKIQKLTLIDGEFSFEEAKEILNNIFMYKINFHNLKNWSSNERFGKEDEIAQKRIPALKKETERLLEFLSDEKIKNKRIIISSLINISILDE